MNEVKLSQIATQPADMLPIAKTIITHLGMPRKIALLGEMGAGKTTFVHAFAQALGVGKPTSSPTFSLINVYEYPGGQISHLDLYRLKSAEEAFDIGLETVLDDPYWCIIEWPQVAAPLLPPDIVTIEISVHDNFERLIELKT
jgi:tRNA threonylcarbamoyladenosine biosynthesis protein TsaE